MLSHPGIVTGAAGLILSLCYAVLTLHIGQQRVVSILDGIFGGAIASLMTYAIVQSVFLQRSAHSLRNWLRFGHHNVWVLPTSLQHPTDSRYSPRPYYVVPPFDAQATGVLTHVLRHAHYKYPLRRIVGSHIFDRALLTDNIVTLCLPTRNVYSRVFLGIFREIYQEGHPVAEAIRAENVDAYVQDVECQREYFGFKVTPRPDMWAEWRVRNFNDQTPNRWLTSTINEEGVIEAHADGRVAVDYGLILKAPNPFNSDAGVLLVGGIHGVGTFGAALYLFEQADRMLEMHGDEPQVHLIEVEYMIPRGRNNYVDAEIQHPLLLRSSKLLSEIPREHARPAA
jgi:hypothetical protein